MKNEAAGLLTLPRELRDKIYEYLLRINRFDTSNYDKKHLFKLALSILRVNRTLHSEASEAFDEKNSLVCIIIEPGLLRNLRDGMIRDKKVFPGDKHVLLANHARATATAAAKIILRRSFPLSASGDQARLLVSSFAIPRLCRLLTALNKDSRLDLLVILDSPKNRKSEKACHEYLLDCFQEARGFECVKIVDNEGNTSHVELATLMMSPFTKLCEAVDRVSIYYDHALQKQNLGRLFEARCDYQDGHDFIYWLACSYDDLDLSDDSIHDEYLDDQFFRLSADIGFSCAFLCIELGDLNRALHFIDETLELQEQEEEEEEEEEEEKEEVSRAEAWFLYGLRDVMIGASNGAAYCFLQTLWKQPGQLGADDAVDELEARLRSCAGLTERIILHNIQHVLQPFRHQTPGSAVMSKDEYGLLLQQWYAGKKEVDSFCHRHHSSGSMCLAYMNRCKYSL